MGKAIAGVTAVIGVITLALPLDTLASAFVREIRKRDFVVTWSILARVPTFARLSATELDEIMRRLNARYCEEGDVIVRRGEPADAMYFITSGEVEIELSERPVRLHAGDFFGEMAILSEFKGG